MLVITDLYEEKSIESRSYVSAKHLIVREKCSRDDKDLKYFTYYFYIYFLSKLLII